MEEFLRREGGKDGRLPVPEESKEMVFKAAMHCVKVKKSELSFRAIDCPARKRHAIVLPLLTHFSLGDRPCDSVSDYLQAVGHMPTFRAKDGCIVFDEDAYHGKQITPDHKKSAIDFCAVSAVARCRFLLVVY
jgi:hypothetical protein